MSTTYENLQSLESEKKSQRIKNGLPAPQVLLQHLCSGPRLFLLFLGLSLLLLVGICVIGSKSSNIQRDLETLRATYSNFTSNTEAQVQALHAQGGLLQEMIKSLKLEVENQGQQLQADYSDMLMRVQVLDKKLTSLNLQMAVLKSNGSHTTSCPINWLERECSCYWFSSTGKPWPEAEKYCELENAHLVVVSSLEEQKFLQQQISSVDTWIGLTDQNGSWTWMDGTDYEKGFQFWSPQQPDNWTGHNLGGGEDCAHFMDSGQWNDNVCMRPFHWICEKKLGRAS